VSLDLWFSSGADDYVSFWFKSDQQDLTAGEIFPEVGGYGTRPVHVHHTGGDGWHANCKLPPGLGAGWHEARLRVRNSAFSNTVRIGVDISDEQRHAASIARPSSDLVIRLVTDGKNWDRYRIHTGPEACLSLWVEGLPEICDRSAVLVRLNGAELPAVFVSGHDREGLSQVNALLPSGVPPGRAAISLVFGESESRPVEAELV
jgi:hypothetical protein